MFLIHDQHIISHASSWCVTPVCAHIYKQSTPSGIVTDLKMGVNLLTVFIHTYIHIYILKFNSWWFPQQPHATDCVSMHLFVHIRRNASEFLLSASPSCINFWALVAVKWLFTTVWIERGRSTLVSVCVRVCASNLCSMCGSACKSVQS